MKKLLLAVSLIGLVALALGGTAGAQQPKLTSPAPVADAVTSTLRPVWASLADSIVPTVTAIDPASAANDIGSPVTITGADFEAVMDGMVVVTAPTVSLGGTALTDVTFVDSTTLTATVPWGMDPGSYTLSVTNPDDGAGTLFGAFTVEAGIGHWNGGNLFGGDVRQILIKPGDSHTLYAPAYGINGLFRSSDAGEHWTYTGAGLPMGNAVLAIDPNTPGRLYACTFRGLERSTDDGDTWTTIMENAWPDGRDWAATEVFPSPSDSKVLFISSHDNWGFPASGNALGLIKSTDGGTSWHIVADLEGVSVVGVAFDPADPQRMALVTTDARVFKSIDGGNDWLQALASPPIAGVGLWGTIAYNPFRTGEVWIVSLTPDGVFKSTDAALTGWTDETPPYSGSTQITFTSADSVYIVPFHSTTGGTKWDPFGPIHGTGQLVFDPTDPLVGYLGDTTDGVQKTTDGGTSWEVKNNGLAGLTCASMDVSSADPLRIYAVMGASSGAYRSDDGAGDWSLSSLPGGANGLFGIREDPTDSARVYASGNGSFYSSGDRGRTWSDLGWNATPPVPTGMGWTMEPDPFKSGHVLVGIGSGMYLTGEGYLYSSTDYGASWQQIAMPQSVDLINDIAFDPVTPGLVYLTTMGTGVYRSTDGGSSWARIDDPEKQPGLQTTGYKQCIAIATHPQHMVTVGGSDGHLYRSVDDGATWQRATGGEYPGADMFVDGDSTRLYRGTGLGLFFSKDVGDTWTRAAGAFGDLQIMQVGYADMDGHAIIYAATSGGQAGASASAATSRQTTATASEPVAAGIYRYVVVTPKVTLKLSGLSGGALRLGRRLAAKGLVTPSALAGSKVSLTVQRRQNGTWRKVKTALCTVRVGGAYSWTYRPPKRGVFRVQATFAKTATSMAATTKWRVFKVK